MTDPADPTPASPAPTAQPVSAAVQLRALSWWLGAMALGGMVFGMYGAQRPFGGGDITHPAFIFAGLAVVGLLILRFAGDRPLISDRSLIAGLVIGVASYLLGIWFGMELLVVH